jgi:RHS repeat-associated protein
VTNNGLNSYLYDAEGRICAANTRSNLQSSDPAFLGYIYDAAGIRVARGYMSTFSCNFSTNGFVATTSWALGENNEQLGEWKLQGGTWTWQHSNAYVGSTLLGTYDQSGLHFYFNDWLGTRRIQANALGQVELTCTSLPFGNGENCTPSALSTAEDPTEQHFTGKERDTESGNDYFEARYYSSSLGRFMSPDWSARVAPVPYAKLDDPQSLNLYGYVRNNPMTRIDPDGHVDPVGLCKKHPCKVTVTQTLNLVSGSKVTSTLKLTTTFDIKSSSDGKISVAASSKAEYVSGDKLSDARLAVIGNNSGLIQQSAALMGFGDKTTQAMSALAAAESVFGTSAPGEKAAWKAPAINPLQLSGGLARGNTLEQNIEGALDVYDGAGQRHGFSDPKRVYRGGFDDGSGAAGRHFNRIYDSIKETATVQ